MRKLNIGDRLKRKFHDFKEVELIGHFADHIVIKDSNGEHFIQLDKIDQFFVLLEPDEVNALHTNYTDKKE